MDRDLVRVYECSKCTGLVVPMQKEGRYYEYRGVYIQVPKDVVIPRCTSCGEEWLDTLLTERLAAVLEAAYRDHEGMIDIIKKLGGKRRNLFPG